MARLDLLRTIASIVTLSYVVYIPVASPLFRQTILTTFSPKTYPIRFLALLLALLLNAKALPLVWHFRLFRTMFYQLYFQPTSLPKDALLRPVVKTGFHSPLAQCDYNGHKSNSTYFADLDIARTALVSCLLRKGITAQWSRAGVKLKETSGSVDTSAAKGMYTVALGGVNCTFKREIKPYERYEIWTRVLSWDRKWIYLISHIVKEGAVKPDEFALQPWLEQNSEKVGGKEEEVRTRWQKAVFATSIAKYVVKKGRMTIPPEIILRTNEIFPLAPEEDGYAEWRKAVVAEGIEGWNWDFVEEERKRGLKLVEGLVAVETLIEEFPLSESMLRLKGTTGKSANGDSVNGHADEINGTMDKARSAVKVRVMGQFRDWTLSL